MNDQYNSKFIPTIKERMFVVLQHAGLDALEDETAAQILVEMLGIVDDALNERTGEILSFMFQIRQERWAAQKSGKITEYIEGTLEWNFIDTLEKMIEDKFLKF